MPLTQAQQKRIDYLVNNGRLQDATDLLNTQDFVANSQTPRVKDILRGTAEQPIATKFDVSGISQDTPTPVQRKALAATPSRYTAQPQKNSPLYDAMEEILAAKDTVQRRASGKFLPGERGTAEVIAGDKSMFYDFNKGVTGFNTATEAAMGKSFDEILKITGAQKDVAAATLGNAEAKSKLAESAREDKSLDVALQQLTLAGIGQPSQDDEQTRLARMAEFLLTGRRK